MLFGRLKGEKIYVWFVCLFMIGVWFGVLFGFIDYKVEGM